MILEFYNYIHILIYPQFQERPSIDPGWSCMVHTKPAISSSAGTCSISLINFQITTIYII